MINYGDNQFETDDVFPLTEQQAMSIATMREDLTWRELARECAGMWPGLGIIAGNQIHGMRLCMSAEQVLGVRVE